MPSPPDAHHITYHLSCHTPSPVRHVSAHYFPSTQSRETLKYAPGFNQG